MLQRPKMLMVLRRDETGVTALEYGLIAAVIAGVIITAFSTFATRLSLIFTDLASYLGTLGK